MLEKIKNKFVYVFIFINLIIIICITILFFDNKKLKKELYGECQKIKEELKPQEDSKTKNELKLLLDSLKSKSTDNNFFFKLNEKINSLENIIKDNEEDEKTDAIFKRTITSFQNSLNVTQNNEERQNYEQLIRLIEQFQQGAKLRDDLKNQIEENQNLMNITPSLSQESMQSTTSLVEKIQNLKDARSYLNSYAQIISMHLEDAEKLKSIEAKPSQKALLKQITNILTEDLTKQLLKSIRLNARREIPRLLSRLNIQLNQ
ncbi:putative membrane protein [Candidatus Phytoplasma solani]|uniref:hypothetical protein n=1 Tax=Candidatus Phytoplasma solani TaxID=69896 RepID=UPI0032DB3B96